ncbi:3-hydroxyacyl-ACP dehydratase FabZ family protein [Kibdelosporangium persicum]|uniref:3-hydroxyacyl-[acyl-carrier-protein] dehydratase n=1 Tax=Kibdelosporangium persicum TaxID=2698649 RepID=A0ABX2FJE9_9PSEU|nr:hypothetical protein [Kibdelosporangium persicum]NRN70955.1 3-hydroxyacyl-[acyl-carrier-protein] dehydratase [Kibdelosporangium persicum]
MTAAVALPAEVEVLSRSAQGVSSAFTVDPDDEVFAGHYPGFPVLPGVMLLEAAARTARQWERMPPGELVAMDRARFLRPVRPGERVTTDVEVIPDGDGSSVRATARTDAGRVAEFRMRFGKRPVVSPAGHLLDRIMLTIPHRRSSLLLDRVDDVRPGQSLVARKVVSASEPCFHRDGVLDGVGTAEYPPALVVESCAQAAALLAVWEQPNPDVLAGKVELAGALNGVTFGGRVVPGDVLVHEVSMVRALDDTAIVTGRTSVDGTPVLEIESFVLALREISDCG